MKRILTAFAITLVAVVWMTGSWFFFNSIAAGAQGTAAPAVTGSKDEAAAEGHCDKHWKGHHGHRGLWKKLNLTDEQRDSIRSITTEERAKIRPLVQQLKDGREQLNALRKSGPFDEAKVRSVAKGQADTLIDLIVTRERMKSRIYAVLTPEQQAKAEKIRESWKARHGKEGMRND